MSAVLTGNAAPRLKCGKKSGLTSGMSCDVNPFEGKCNTPKSYQKTERVQAFGGNGKRTREQRLSGKSGLRKKRPSQKVDFFVDRKIRDLGTVLVFINNNWQIQTIFWPNPFRFAGT